MVPWLTGVFEHMRALVQIGWPALDPISDHSIAKYEAEVAGAGVVAAAARVMGAGERKFLIAGRLSQKL